MRRKAFSVILSLVMMLGIMPQAAIPSLAASGDVITFPDANFEAAVRVMIGKPTGAITKGDVEGVAELHIWERNIADLTGIEYFTALERLWCGANQLTALDVSKNTALTELVCYENQLDSLDMSKNTALKRLNCDDNRLTSLDVSKNIELKNLSCDDNQLTALDVSKNMVLTLLNCWRNQLTSLDVSNNTELAQLLCYENQLTALDLSKNIELKTLDCDGNQLTVLDVSKNTALEDLWCFNNQLTSLDVSKNIALKWLSCDGNQLTALDVSKNTELLHLNCSRNQLAVLDVSQNTKLESLWCDDNQLTALDVSKNTALETLWCTYNQLTALDISKNTGLAYLQCSYNYIPFKSAIIGIDESNLEIFEFLPQNIYVPAPNQGTASAWALDHINIAYAKNLIPVELQNNYQAPITRGEFVRLAMGWLQYYTNESYDYMLYARGLTRGAFSDTTDPVILAAAALGITAGVGNGKFGVNDQFNREQAAVMLANVRRILGEDTDNAPGFGFADIDAASSWALDAINYVGGADIMAGVGGNRFDPKGTFSREQSIIVFNKMG